MLRTNDLLKPLRLFWLTRREILLRLAIVVLACCWICGMSLIGWGSGYVVNYPAWKYSVISYSNFMVQVRLWAIIATAVGVAAVAPVIFLAITMRAANRIRIFCWLFIGYFSGWACATAGWVIYLLVTVSNTDYLIAILGWGLVWLVTALVATACFLLLS